MTVIFHTNAGAPVLAGDMLLSKSGLNVHTELRLPSQPGGIKIPSDQIPTYTPVRMRRKILVVNDRMAVGAAGSVLHIRRFIDDLTGEFRNKSKFTYTEIRSFLDQYVLSNFGEKLLEHVRVLILAEATDWRGSLTSGLTNERNRISSHFGRVIAIGTGSDCILEHVQKFDNNYSYRVSQPPDGEVQFPEFGTLAKNLNLLANVYWNEFVSPNNIFEGWGGAYDLIYQDSNKVFQYLNEYTIFIRLFDIDQTEKGIQLANVLKYERRSDFSFITMLNGEKLDFFAAKDISASETPLKVFLDGDDLTLNSNVHISIIAVGKGNKFLLPMIQIDGLDPSERTKQTVFTWFDKEKKLCVAFHAEHDKWLKQEAISYYYRHLADS